MNSPRFRLLTVGFWLLLLLPTLDQLLGLSARFESTENRRASEIPAFHFPHINSFVRQFDQYYKENFGWRNALFYAYSRWQYWGLGGSPLPEKVVVGKEGWLFLGDHFSDGIKQYRGLKPLGVDSARYMADRIEYLHKRLDSAGIKLYILIAPNSQSVYPEFLPDHILPATYPSINDGNDSAAQQPLDVLKNALRSHRDVPFIDLRDTLRAVKKKYQVYQQTDSHWNSFGALVASSVLVEQIHKDFPGVPQISLNNYHVSTMAGWGGDLITMMTLQHEVKDKIFYDIRLVDTTRIPVRADTTVNSKTGLPSYRFVNPKIKGPKLFFMGDSFSLPMVNLLAPYFGDSYFVRGHAINYEVLKKEKPQIVVIEIVERNIRWLSNL